MSQPSQLKEVVRDQWTHAADAWRRWHPKFSEMSRDVTDALCAAADLKPGQAVLDLAGGTGEPGLTAAKAVAPNGSVVCTDFVPGMVATAEDNAKAAGITNMTFQAVDAEDIPFEDGRFDRVISRFGVMFFPDVQKALGEIRRVMKPDTKATFAVWQQVAKNPWFNEFNTILREAGLVQPPPPDMPTPFRFGEPGSLVKELEAAGFKNVNEKPVSISWTWPGSPDEWMEFSQNTFPAWRKGLAEADESARNDALAKMRAAAERYSDGSKVKWGGEIYVVTADR